MLGAIIGDVAGSRFEWHPHKSKDFDFICDECFWTDDSVLTIAVASAISSGADMAETLRGYALRPFPR